MAGNGAEERSAKVIPFPLHRAGEAEVAPEGGTWNGTGEDDGENEDEHDGTPVAGRKRLKIVIAVLLVVALAGNALAFLPTIYNLEAIRFLRKSAELSRLELVQQAKQAVVAVRADDRKGTGFNLSPDGLVVTNHHVVADSRQLVVDFGRNGTFAAEVAASDPGLDVAVLRVLRPNRELPALKLETEAGWQPGDPFYIIGNPLFFTRIANEGTVLGSIAVAGRDSPVLALKAPVYRGNSGSPVINLEGKVFAVVFATAKITREGETANVGLAVPVKEWLALLPEEDRAVP